MSTATSKRTGRHIAWVSVLAALLGYVSFVDVVSRKWIALAACAAAIVLLLRWDVEPLRRRGVLLLLAYAAFTAFSAFWAMAGKFCIWENTKLFTALPLFLFVLLYPRFDRDFIRRVLLALAGVGAVYAVLSVEGASINLIKGLFEGWASIELVQSSFNARLYGVMLNSNIEAGIYGLCIFSALAALGGAKQKGERIAAMALAALNAFAFLLCISLGATASFAVGVLVYLAAAGRARVRVLLRMLAAALPALLFGVLSVPCYNALGSTRLLPLPLMAAAAALSVLLELKLVPPLSARLERYRRLPLLLPLGALALFAVYMLAALNLTGAYTFGGVLTRADYTAPGAHALSVEADGDVEVYIYSQSRNEILQGTSTELYRGSADGAEFTVPEQSLACYYTFTGEPGVTLSTAAIDGAAPLPLDYRILPGFIADRLQAIGASSSLVIRRTLWVWGLRLFRLSPIVGHAPGAFEAGIRRVEDTSYSTKFPHNHYVRVLLEGGVIGFALYMGALICIAAALIKKRASAEDEELGWAYPALCGAFVMFCLVTFWDLSMSHISFLCIVFVLWALILRLYDAPLPKKEQPAGTKAEQAAASRKNEQRKRVLRTVCILIPAVFSLTVCGNLAANHLGGRVASSYNAFFSDLERASAIDLYEKNDWMLTYVVNVVKESAEERYDTADAYAAKMMKEQSNSLPYQLASYYSDRGKYGLCIQAAKNSAVYSAADPATWHSMIDILWDYFVLKPDGLENHMELLPELGSYLDLLDERNATAIEAITLDEEGQLAFDTMKELVEAYGRDPEEAARLLQEAIAAYSQWEEAV